MFIDLLAIALVTATNPEKFDLSLNPSYTSCSSYCACYNTVISGVCTFINENIVSFQSPHKIKLKSTKICTGCFNMAKIIKFIDENNASDKSQDTQFNINGKIINLVKSKTGELENEFIGVSIAKKAYLVVIKEQTSEFFKRYHFNELIEIPDDVYTLSDTTVPRFTGSELSMPVLFVLHSGKFYMSNSMEDQNVIDIPRMDLMDYSIYLYYVFLACIPIWILMAVSQIKKYINKPKTN